MSEQACEERFHPPADLTSLPREQVGASVGAERAVGPVCYLHPPRKMTQAAEIKCLVPSFFSLHVKYF